METGMKILEKNTGKMIIVVLMDMVSAILGLALYQRNFFMTEIPQAGMIFFVLPIFFSVWLGMAAGDANKTGGLIVVMGNVALLGNVLFRVIYTIFIVYAMSNGMFTGELVEHIVLIAFYLGALVIAAATAAVSFLSRLGCEIEGGD